MHTPCHNRTGLPKAIAISATLCILCFGLCSTGLLTTVSNRQWPTALIAMFAVAGDLAIISFIVMLILVTISAYRDKRKRRNRL
jgi:uncharacterized membrane protein